MSNLFPGGLVELFFWVVVVGAYMVGAFIVGGWLQVSVSLILLSLGIWVGYGDSRDDKRCKPKAG